jgi:hypothetical protein
MSAAPTFQISVFKNETPTNPLLSITVSSPLHGHSTAMVYVLSCHLNLGHTIQVPFAHLPSRVVVIIRVRL